MIILTRFRAFALALAVATPMGAQAFDGTDPSAASMPGVFFGTLPLPGCAEADALLHLGADHRYALQAHCRTTLEDLPVERGQWSTEWNGTCVRLLSDRLAGPREFAVPLDNLLVLADGSCIEPIDDPRGRSLHRAMPAAEAD